MLFSECFPFMTLQDVALLLPQTDFSSERQAVNRNPMTNGSDSETGTFVQTKIIRPIVHLNMQTHKPGAITLSLPMLPSRQFQFQCLESLKTLTRLMCVHRE